MEFKKEWTKEDFEMMQKAIVRHFRNKTINTYHGIVHFKQSFKHIDNVLGLAYTSTSSYAGYWTCNTEAYKTDEKAYHYNAFAIDENGKPFAIFIDSLENQIFQEL